MQKATLKSRIGSILIPKLPVSREVFEILRFECNAFLIRLDCTINPFKIGKIRSIKNRSGLSVNVGAGPFGEPGWVNIDLFKAKNISFTYDCRKKLPFANNAVARIRCEHVLEHLDKQDQVPYFLKDCYRTLKPGGIIRIVVPDAARFIQAYCKNTAEAWHELGINIADYNDDWLPMDNLNKIFRQGGEHKFGYDFETLRVSLARAGFKTITKVDYRQSADSLLVNDQENHRFHSLYAEGIKE